ncbi:TetR family transcriptional regulator [Tsukamurella spumae]|uniref:TetR family transcriptional regulator n=1 Tax=Tsukamurella spumae TaxID=44753 RepID=A0A846WXH5_9ACTN|nr:TetR family transcriptional regulator [Tsukamurella spumae]NKY17907.1 TetR family transcriptional regulator [Tsukamurella spumae]
MITAVGPAARILSAYTDLVVERGIRAATLASVATRAELSKSGTLHHFSSMAALQEGLFTELRAQAERDVNTMREAPEGALRYYLRSSLDRQSRLERLVEACVRIAQTGNPDALTVLRECRAGWLNLLESALGDPTLARMALFVGDGLNYNALLSLEENEQVLTPDHVESLTVAFESMYAQRRS